MFANAAAVTVSDGAQFQLGNNAVTNWSLGTGAILTLNGPGKPVGTANRFGALRLQPTSTTSFDNPVNLATTSSVFVNGNATTLGNLTLSQVVSGGGQLTKVGTGILNLTQPNTYAGGTSVNEGVLWANNTTGSATGTGPVTVNLGGTLGGAGTISGAVSFVGGALAPGNSPGLITLGETSFDADSLLNFELGAPNVLDPAINDLALVNGNLVLDGTLNVTGLAGFGLGTYRLINFTGLLTDNTLAVGLLPAGFSGAIVTGQNSVDLLVSPVPEPATWLLASVGLIALVARIRNQRRRGSD